MRFLTGLLIALFIVSCSKEQEFVGSEVLVYVKNQNDERGLYQSDILGKWERELLDGAGAEWNPQWNAGLQKMTFYHQEGNDQVLMKSFDTGTKQVKYFKNYGFSTPKLGPNGKKLFYTRLKSGSRHIWWSNIDGKNRRQLTIGVGLNGPFSIAPDGSKMAYVSNNTGTYELYVMDLNSLMIKQLTDNTSIEKFSSWSPKSDQIAFTMREDKANSKPDIYIINADGSGLAQISNTPYAETEVSWSLSGKKLAFHGITENDGDQIYTIDIADGKFTKITSGNDVHSEPTWIPERQN
ncbi:TolB family protein [Roseivirga sp.]|uniref:TolB family protein n=1 Tax=Roseivirga sp. TaxID=1964215 RepID=UPI003B8E32A5